MDVAPFPTSDLNKRLCFDDTKNTILRTESDDDLAEIERLARTIWEECFHGMISVRQIDYMLNKMYSLAEFKKDIASGVIYERALCGKRLVGFSAFGPGEDSKEVTLHKLYIHADFRGTGCGYSLVQRAVDFAEKVDRRRIVLRVNKGNELAISAYQRMGFSIREGIINDIGAGFVMDDFVMELELIGV